MLSINTAKLRVGDVIVVDGKPRQVVAKLKAFSAPEYFISFKIGVEMVTRVYHSNKKFTVGA